MEVDRATNNTKGTKFAYLQKEQKKLNISIFSAEGKRDIKKLRQYLLWWVFYLLALLPCTQGWEKRTSLRAHDQRCKHEEAAISLCLICSLWEVNPLRMTGQANFAFLQQLTVLQLWLCNTKGTTVISTRWWLPFHPGTLGNPPACLEEMTSMLHSVYGKIINTFPEPPNLAPLTIWSRWQEHFAWAGVDIHFLWMTVYLMWSMRSYFPSH